MSYAESEERNFYKQRMGEGLEYVKVPGKGFKYHEGGDGWMVWFL